MDFFEVYPTLKENGSLLLKDRALRLLTISAIVYDHDAFYFEIGRREMWGRLPGGRFAIGIGATRVNPAPHNAPAKVLTLHLRKTWRCDVSTILSPKIYVLGDDQRIAVLDGDSSSQPYMLILTPPRLGGGDEIPDALVQAIHVLKIQRFRKKAGGVGLLKIKREAWRDFLAPVDWELNTLTAQPWAEFLLSSALPKNAKIRPVLALRGLQNFLKLGELPQTLVPETGA